MQIADRLKAVVESQTPVKRRFPILEALTGISENTWRTWWNRGMAPSSLLVEACGKAWPAFAFWLCTGFTDSEHGHVSPSGDTTDVTIESNQDRAVRLKALLETQLPIAAHSAIQAEIQRLTEIDLARSALIRPAPE